MTCPAHLYGSVIGCEVCAHNDWIKRRADCYASPRWSSTGPNLQQVSKHRGLWFWRDGTKSEWVTIRMEQ